MVADPQTGSGRPAGAARVLVVGDERSFRDELTEPLQTLGCLVEAAADVHEARQVLATVACDLVLADAALRGPSFSALIREAGDPDQHDRVPEETIRGRWSAPTRSAASPFRAILDGLHAKYRSLDEGRVADYIPELAKADPDWFAISVVTVDGQSFDVGESTQPFTMQSVSKPFVYGLALEQHGRAAVLEKVGVEPTGDVFNSIIQLDDASKRPYNPMVNAGRRQRLLAVGRRGTAVRTGIQSAWLVLQSVYLAVQSSQIFRLPSSRRSACQ